MRTPGEAASRKPQASSNGRRQNRMTVSRVIVLVRRRRASSHDTSPGQDAQAPRMSSLGHAQATSLPEVVLSSNGAQARLPTNAVLVVAPDLVRSGGTAAAPPAPQEEASVVCPETRAAVRNSGIVTALVSTAQLFRRVKGHKISRPVQSVAAIYDEYYGRGGFRDVPVAGGIAALEAKFQATWRAGYSSVEMRHFLNFKRLALAITKIADSSSSSGGGRGGEEEQEDHEEQEQGGGDDPRLTRLLDELDIEFIEKDMKGSLPKLINYMKTRYGREVFK